MIWNSFFFFFASMLYVNVSFHGTIILLLYIAH